MGCFSKLGLFILNFLVFAVGLAVVVLASVVIHKDTTIGVLLQGGIFTLPICILIAGLIVLLIGFLGCCGAIKENSCMLKTYAAIVLVLFIAEIVLGIMVFVYTDKAEAFIQDGMTDSFNKYGGVDEQLTKGLDVVQHDLECCGVTGFQNWQNYTYGKEPESLNDVASGCCKEETEGCNKGMATKSEEEAMKTIYTEGCYDAVKNQLMGVTIGLGAATVVLAVVQIMAICCACGLAKNSKQGYA